MCNKLGIPFRSLGELVERDMLTAQVADLLAACVRARLSIVFAGPPGSGKTTLLSCTTAGLDPSLRLVVAEEVFESDIPCPTCPRCRPAPPGRGVWPREMRWYPSIRSHW